MLKKLLPLLLGILPQLALADGWVVTNTCVSVNATPKIEILIEESYDSLGVLLEAKASVDGRTPELVTVVEKTSDLDPNFTVREWSSKDFRIEGYFENLTGRRNFTGHYFKAGEQVKLSCYF